MTNAREPSDTDLALAGSVEGWLQATKDAVAREREACANLVENTDLWKVTTALSSARDVLKNIAASIRARGKP
jgi:hypothetical protein